MGIVASSIVAQSGDYHNSGTSRAKWFSALDSDYLDESGFDVEVELDWWIYGPKAGEGSENIGTRLFDVEGFFGFEIDASIDDWDSLWYEGERYDVRELENVGIDVRDRVEISKVAFKISVMRHGAYHVMTLEFDEYVNDDGEARRSPIAMTQGSLHGGRDLDPERIAELMYDGPLYISFSIVDVEFRGLAGVARAGDAEKRRERLISQGESRLDYDDYTEAIAAFSSAQSIRETDYVAQRLAYARQLRDEEFERRAEENESDRTASAPPTRSQEDIDREAGQAMAEGAMATMELAGMFAASGGYIGLHMASESIGIALAWPGDLLGFYGAGTVGSAFDKQQAAPHDIETGDLYFIKNWMTLGLDYNVTGGDHYSGLGTVRPYLAGTITFIALYERGDDRFAWDDWLEYGSTFGM